MTDAPRPGHYVRFQRRITRWPYTEDAYGIVCGTPKYGVRVKALDTFKRHVLRLTSIRVVTMQEAFLALPWKDSHGIVHPGDGAFRR